MIFSEPAEAYHAREAVSASLLWDLVSPESCPALAKYNSAWLNPDHAPEHNEDLDNGTIVHLACLEPHLLDARITVIDARDWRTKEARERRLAARAEGKLPILAERDSGVSYSTIGTIRTALENSAAAPLLFGEGISEVSFTWDQPVVAIGGVACKARADRIVPKTRVLVDLKTALSASPPAFQQATVRWGHHLRAAFYSFGWAQQEEQLGELWDYVFVVVAKPPPHLVSCYKLGDRALAWGERLARRALADFTRAQSLDRWPGYTGEVATIDLPTFAEYRLADMEAAGALNV